MRCRGIALIGWLLASAIFAAEEPDELSAPANYELVVRDLIDYLGKDRNSAQDASVKLASLGKRSLGILMETFQSNFPKGNEQIAYYSAYSLSRMKNAEAARTLLPILSNEKAGVELRELAIRAHGLEFADEGANVLQKVAANDGNILLRRMAYTQLALSPVFWAKSEQTFVAALSDPDDEIRALAAKVCYFAKIFRTAEPKLISLAETERNEGARIHAILALLQMRSKPAVAALVRLAADETLSPSLQKVVLQALSMITQVPFKNLAGVQPWWEKTGTAEYAKLEPPKAPGTVLKPAANAGPAGEIVEAPLEAGARPRRKRQTEEPSTTAQEENKSEAERLAVKRAAFEALAPKEEEESTGSRRRRERQLQEKSK